MAGEKVCDIEVSLQSVPSLDGLAHFDDAIYKPHSVMVKIKPAVIVWLSALHNFFVCLFRFCTLRFIPIVFEKVGRSSSKHVIFISSYVCSLASERSA